MSNLKMFKALNEQVKFEYYSSYMYLSMSAYFADAGLQRDLRRSRQRP